MIIFHGYVTIQTRLIQIPTIQTLKNILRGPQLEKKNFILKKSIDI